MIGVGTGPLFRAFGGVSGPIDYAFASGQLPVALSFSRTGAGTRHDASGAIVNVGADQPRFDHGALGDLPAALLYEPEATNFAGYASEPGHADGWIGATTHNGLTIDLVATGIVGDLAYADYRVQGSATSNFTDKFYLSSPSRTATAQGETFTGSCFVQVIGGTTDNIGKFTVSVVEEDGVEAFIGQSISGWTIDFPTLTRISATRTMEDAAAGYVRLAMVLSSLTVGAPIDITLRLAGPQLERAAAPSSFVQVPGALAVTRGDDRLFLPSYSGDRQITVTFRDAGPEVLSSASLVGGQLPRFTGHEITGISVAPV